MSGAIRSGNSTAGWGLVFLCALWASTADAAEPFTLETLRPYMGNEMNVLDLNHIFLQSVLASNTPVMLTAGVGIRSAPVSFARVDGNATKAGLAKLMLVVAAAGGDARDGFALFGGALVSRVTPSGFPNILGWSGDRESYIPLRSDNLLLFTGVAFHGLAIQAGLLANTLSYTADGAGLFVGGGCSGEWGCGGRPIRDGAPVPEPPEAIKFGEGHAMLNLEHESGFSAAVLLGRWGFSSRAGHWRSDDVFVGFKAFAQPRALTNLVLGSLGMGVNGYDATMDYYGDRSAAEREAARGSEPATDHRGRMIEVPLRSDGIANTGLGARMILQASPDVLFRLAEVKYVAEMAIGSWVIQAGARVQTFRRGSRFVPSSDAYLGATFGGSDREKSRLSSGWTLYLSHSYNSPDSLTFVPLADAHVLGLQVVYGNPKGIPPPVSIVRYPLVGEDHAANQDTVGAADD